jgi:CDP-diacylglycerol--glycerol-3-phosphate 3-phosphatidyltransferase
MMGIIDRDGTLSIANYITFFRIFISPIFLLVYMEYEYLGISRMLLPYVLLFLWAVSELSDAFDGYVARRYNQVTNFGKILDPMADSLTHISMLLSFTLPPVNLHLLLIFAFLYRDSVITTLRTICALKGFTLAARTSGKIKTVLQAAAVLMIILALIPHSLGELSDWGLHWISFSCVAFTALYAFISGVEYIYANRQYVIKILSKQTVVGKEGLDSL